MGFDTKYLSLYAADEPVRLMIEKITKLIDEEGWILKFGHGKVDQAVEAVRATIDIHKENQECEEKKQSQDVIKRKVKDIFEW